MATLSRLTIPVKDPSTGTVTPQTFDLAGSGSADAYSVNDTASTTINNGDYIPMLDADGTTKKKSLWSTIIAKIKSSLGSAAVKDVPTSGDASSTQVVMGNDSRLTDSRPASDVSSWAKASTKPSYTATEVGAIPTTDKGANNGVAELDATGKVPSSQLPSFVDDVVEGYYKSANGKFYKESTYTTEIAGESGKIYISLDTNKTYRWSGSIYAEISASLALGETSSTAYYGDKGKIAYDHSQSAHARTDATKVESSSTNGNIKINGIETTVYTHPGSGTNPHGTTASDVGLGNVGNFKAVSTVASQGLSSTEKSNARDNIGAGTSSFSGNYNDLTNKPTLGTAAAKASTNAVTQNSTDLVESGAVYSEIVRLDNQEKILDCSTSRATAAKTVSLSGFMLKEGAKVTIRFTDTGSSNPSSGNLTLEVNGTGAKPIVDGHTNNTVQTYSNATYFYNNMVCEFVYDGTNWVWLNRDKDTTYTGATLKTKAAQTGTSQSSVSTSIAVNTAMDSAIGTLLNNDVTLNTKSYQTGDNAETTLADGDYFPFYDTSASAKKKTLWSNIIAKIKSALGTAAVKNSTNAVSSGNTGLVESGAVFDYFNNAVDFIYQNNRLYKKDPS